MPEELQVTMVLSQHKAGLLTLNEARELLDMPKRDDKAADKIYMPAYLLGGAPVSYDDYDSDLERMLNLGSMGVEDSEASGNAGGEDNTNVETETRGGEQVD